jgi:hypothetical protein
MSVTAAPSSPAIPEISSAPLRPDAKAAWVAWCSSGPVTAGAARMIARAWPPATALRAGYAQLATAARISPARFPTHIR